MEDMKYILVPKKLIKEFRRYFIHFYLPDSEEFYFVMAKQTCKKFKADENYYLARLNLDSHAQNRHLYKSDDDEMIEEFPSERFLEIFEEYNEDLLYAQKHFKNHKN